MFIFSADYTVLAPSDEAFQFLPGTVLDEITNNRQKREAFVLRHLIPAQLLLAKFEPNEEKEMTAMDGSPIHIVAYPTGVSSRHYDILSIMTGHVITKQGKNVFL